ncbi:hemolysin, chromosomal [Roseovarius sp. A-2]|uniref:calcium-binding protein n=1 Tax=Roseovarius sp. A-2 TaxID=1570360 RepID=UPI0009B519C9|nr:calcium-binding protein [Roseovarius sp. A-2]GAW37114.1 hemolysin, chromosomal [Roseovarius sp. A-2]
MPTFSISGVLVARDGTDTNIAANPVTLDVVVPEGQTTFTYSILETFPDDLPEVDISTNDVAVGLSGAGVPAGIDITADDGATFLGTVTTTAGDFVALAIEVPRPGGGFFDAIFPIGGTVPAIPANLAEFNALEGTVTGFATATGAFAPGATIDFGTLANTVFDASPNVVQGTDGDDVLEGTAGNDLITTGDNPVEDVVVGSAGSDTIDFTGITGDPGGSVVVDYRSLGTTIDVQVDGAANTGSVVKTGLGTDTLVNVELPLFAGWTTGGLQILGTSGNDRFDVTPEGEQWMSIRPGDGVDTIIASADAAVRVNSGDPIGQLRLDFRDGNGANVNFATRTIANDGFGNAETIGGTGPIWEMMGSAGDDVFVGSDNADSYRYFGGNNTLEGGLGFDRLRYDSLVQSVNIDATAGVATGTHSNGTTFTDTISGFERLRGSNGNDTITGEAGVDNRLEGRNGADTLDGAGGNDTLDGGSGSDWFTIRTGATTIVDFELGTDVIDVQIAGLSVEARNTALRNAAEDNANGGAVADFGNGNTLHFANLSAAEVATLAEPEGPGGGTLVQGSGGDDNLFGTAGDDTILALGGNDFIDAGDGDDVINPGDNLGDSSGGDDFIIPGLGNDTVDFTDQLVGFVSVNYGFLDASGQSITVDIDGGANTGTVGYSGGDMDTFVNVNNPLASGFSTGGLAIRGTAGDDTFNLAPEGEQWMSVRPGDGVDTLNINGTGLVRVDFRVVNEGIDVNLATGVIANDGFGNVDTITGTGSVWEVQGSRLGDRFTGSSSDESYRALGGGNTLDGGAGFDRARYDRSDFTSVQINASTGVVTGTLFDGQSFTDTITGFEYLRGSNGDDTITGEAGVDNRYSGAGGSDTFVHLGGNDRIDDFEIGADVLDLRALNVTEAEIAAALAGAVDTPGGALVSFAGGSSVLLDGLSAAAVATIQPLVSVPGETISSGGTSDALAGGEGDDTITAGAGSDTIDGGEGDDEINTGQGFDLVNAGGGNDLVLGLNGFDTLNGDSGNDTLEGNSGSDELNGGDGDDELQGGQGADLMRGDGGADLLVGREGFDTLEGGTGNDTLQGNFGRDLLRGGDGDDRLEGGVQADTLEGGAGTDLLLGASGADLLNGGEGDDRLEGNAGNDTLDGGAGNDVLRGGQGADTFVFRLGSGNDRVVDFGTVDAVEIEAALLGGGTPDVEDLRDISTLDADGFLLLDFGNGDTLTFTGITNTGAILGDVSFI